MDVLDNAVSATLNGRTWYLSKLEIYVTMWPFEGVPSMTSANVSNLVFPQYIPVPLDNKT